MDYKLPTGAKAAIFSILFSVLGIHTVMGQSKKAKEQIKATYNQTQMASFLSELEAEHQNTAQKISQLKASKGIRISEKAVDGSPIELKAIGSDGTPLYYTTLNDPSTQTSRANALYDNGLLNLGLTGNGMEVGVWDAGIALTTHQEFDTRAKNADGSSEISLHSTLVTGNLISSGVEANAQGVAYGAQAMTYDWTRDKIEVAEAAANGMLLSNHSYGILSDRVPDWYFGAYIKVTQDWDKIMYNAPYYLMVTAAGNAQNSYDNASPNFGKTADGFDLLLGFTTTKNGLTIAGANTEIDKKGNLVKASVAGYSSFGPVDDGRVKPDLAGDGSNILSASSATNSSYQVSSGTSMAAPGVTGSLLLLQQYHEELFGTYMKAATLKGLALHTADDVDAKGPDYKMGWGVMNAKTAAEVLQNNGYTSLVQEESLTNGESFSITVIANGNEPLMASISWTDPEGEYVNRGDLNSTTAALINDLDIRITKNGETHLPWKLNPAKANDAATQGDNKVDPYERIEIDNASGTYTITVTHKGNLKNGAQDFSLIVSGAQVSKCSIETPSSLELISSTVTGSTISWNEAEETLFEVQYKSVDTDVWISEYVWENSFELTNLEMGKVYEARVRSICTENAVSEFSETIEFEFNGEETQMMSYAPLSYPQELNISVFPNPAVDYLNVEAELSKDAQFSIVTTAGNVIRSGKTQGSINVSSLSSGLYVLVVQDYAGIKSTKFYKN
ncbi:S8 family serine peptidase [Flagellimonas pelagia]|uniref:S8 family serine peptidase n=1 Tax=Flagellimonas pelagia TaxID=2306998 RepID=A0A3A1NN11_9FLAO|nr:S8 family serine peptidase [Allomuricauda maritima]RIV44519.1 T9SS C-terminal target domain-containing protein [Allomuricauda maritima]TXJ94582.1 S8 family serine peptidase [Allomuricauda maritima]